MAFILQSSKQQKPSPRKVKAHAKKIFQFVFPRGYAGEFFLCGGAFKPLLDPALKINDLDLWVRSRKERERLTAALLHSGAVLKQDFAPYCIKFEKDDVTIEIAYENVNSGGVAEILSGFDLACSAIGVRHNAGNIDEITISKRLFQSLSEKVVLVEDGYVERLRQQHTPSLLRSIDRMKLFASDTGFEVDTKSSDAMWELFATEYNDEEKKESLDTYMETTVGYKSRCDAEILQRANDLVLGA